MCEGRCLALVPLTVFRLVGHRLGLRPVRVISAAAETPVVAGL
jgi:hypothetical protein